jgi:bifunctional UDP-N-acetylglucosamine pyrophosphorylase/glucosamine-1-phosphate N-acetyltransferase
MKIAVVVLAAGLGTRMKSDVPKVLHTVLGRPMISYVIDAARGIKPSRIIAVINPLHQEVVEYMSSLGVDTAFQGRPLGTADALKSALSKLKGFKDTVIVVNGDTPLLHTGTIKKFISKHERSGADISVLSFKTDTPFSYGRIIRELSGNSWKIVEERDLSGDQRQINEVNSGIYVLNGKALGLLKRVKKNPQKGEYYLTDIVEIGCNAGLKADVISVGREEEFFGVNTMADLLNVQWVLQDKIMSDFMKKGVRFYNPESVIIHDSVKIASDTIIYPNVCLEGKTEIGKGSKIFPGARIVDSTIGRNVSVLDNSVIEESKIGDHSTVGPFARFRPNSVLGKRVKVGNFVEVKNSTLSDGTKANHLSYIGDAIVGKNVNIGAGTITCNYDGVRKHKTVIEDGVFIGSDSQLIAPVRIGKGAYIAAGSTITDDIQAKSLAISRIKQVEYKGWTERKRKGQKK